MMLPSIWRNRSSLVDSSLDDFIERFFYGWPFFRTDSEISWAPRTDVHETDKEVVIDIELPGIEKKDINVTLRDNVLTVSGERRDERKRNGKDFRSVERHYGRFERSFGLPDTVDPEKISARFKNGVLTIKVAKTEEAQPKEIPVEVG